MTTTEKRFLFLFLMVVGLGALVLRLDWLQYQQTNAAIRASEIRQAELVCEALVRVKAADSCTLEKQ